MAAIDAYLSDTPITASEARRRLRIQDRFNNLSDDIAVAIASADFGGTWFDDDDGGRLKIGIKGTQSPPPRSKTAAAEQILEDHDFTDADFVTVDWSVAELDAAEDELDGHLGSLARDGKATTSVSQSTNTLTVERISALIPSDEAELSAAVAEVDVRVVVETVDLASLYGTSGASTCGLIFSTNLVCDTPFRGGAYIEDESTSCTGGFLANSRSDGKLYLLTAGHCVSDMRHPFTVRTADWSTYDKDATRMMIGKPHRGSTDVGQGNIIDAGVIAVIPAGSSNPSPLWAASPPRYVYVTSSTNPGANTTHDERYEIARVRAPAERSIYCMTGAPAFANGRHTVCGRVKKTLQRVRDQGDPLEPRSAIMRIDLCGPGLGSSGGPLYKNHTGYGIFVIFSQGSCRKYFTRLVAAQNVMNVDVIP